MKLERGLLKNKKWNEIVGIHFSYPGGRLPIQNPNKKTLTPSLYPCYQLLSFPTFYLKKAMKVKSEGHKLWYHKSGDTFGTTDNPTK
ncbi:MAG: hypothetical protein ISS94_01055 [Candidatus Syntrophoarchaeum sp.]|nr:hypothetical protein [Candidatus Syntrophoarchaeum sp.]